jgi:hypothetical protein
MGFRHRSCSEEDELADCVDCGEVADQAAGKNPATLATLQYSPELFGLPQAGTVPVWASEKTIDDLADYIDCNKPANRADCGS